MAWNYYFGYEKRQIFEIRGISATKGIHSGPKYFCDVSAVRLEISTSGNR